jgi:hypothetical protein
VTVETDVFLQALVHDPEEPDEHQCGERDRERDYPAMDRRGHGGTISRSSLVCQGVRKPLASACEVRFLGGDKAGGPGTSTLIQAPSAFAVLEPSFVPRPDEGYRSVRRLQLHIQSTEESEHHAF